MAKVGDPDSLWESVPRRWRIENSRKYLRARVLVRSCGCCILIAKKVSYAMRPLQLARSLVRTARLQAGLTQRELAKRARTTQSVVARIELGQTTPGIDTLRRLLSAAGFELHTALEPKPVLDRQLLDDVPRILRLSAEDRLREIGNINRLVARARRA